jgi:adenylate cyclase
MKSSKKDFVKDLFSEELFYNIKIREYILGGVFLILLILILVNFIAVGGESTEPEAIRNAFIGLLILLGFLIVRSFIIRKVFEKKKNRLKKSIWKIRIVNAIFEASIPTAAIILLTFFLEPLAAVNSPAVYLYFVFIIVSILDLDFKICSIVGMLTAIQYFFVVLYFIDSFKAISNLEVFILPTVYLAKSVIMLVSGFAAGAIANHIKNKIVRSLETIHERNELEKLFGQQVSKEIVDEFIDNKLELTSKERIVTVLFLDIRNFSKFCEGKNPEEINQYQNEVLSFMIQIVNKNSGIVNQILGDGFMATFGAPVENDNHTQCAVSAALQIVNKLKIKNMNREIPHTQIGIGIHTGEAYTGNVGTEDRQQYSIIGNTVILASRLEQLNKEFNSSLIVSKDVIDNMKTEGVEFMSLGDVNIKGFANPIDVYKLL